MPPAPEVRGTLMAASEPRSVFARVGLLLAGAIFLFTLENVWLDPWIRSKSHRRLPSFVPESLGGTWVIAFSILVMALILAVVCQVLLSRDRGLAKWKKVLTGLAVLTSGLMVGQWFVATGGTTLVERIPEPQRAHSVTLTWKPSSTKNVRYNVYRGPRPGFHPDKLNDTPIDGLTFTDTKVESGKQYFYVTRAVDGHNQESGDSKETSATIP